MSKKVFVWLKPQFLGDAVMACPMIDSLVASDAQVIVRANPVVQQVLADRAAKVYFATGGKISGMKQVLKAAKELKQESPDAVLLVNRSFRSALAAWLAKVPLRIGHATEGRGFLLTHRIAYDESRFEADCYLDLLEPLGIERGQARPKLTVVEDEIAQAKRLLQDATTLPVAETRMLQSATIGVQPGARYPEKQLPLDTLVDVVKQLQASGSNVVMLGGQDETGDAARFQSKLDRTVLDLVGKCSIRQSLGVLSQLNLMIGSDTGLMHLAAAVGCPTVTVFGPNPISKWGHNYAPHRPLAAPNGIPANVKADEVVRLAMEVLTGS